MRREERDILSPRKPGVTATILKVILFLPAGEVKYI